MESRMLTQAEYTVFNGICSMPRVLDECMYQFADPDDPDSDGKRTRIQVKRHEAMYAHLARSYASGSVGCVYPPIPRRHGLTSLNSMFAFAHAFCFPGSTTCLWVMHAVTHAEVVRDIMAYVAQRACTLPGLSCSEHGDGLVIDFAPSLRSIVYVAVCAPMPTLDSLLVKSNVDLHIIDGVVDGVGVTSVLYKGKADQLVEYEMVTEDVDYGYREDSTGYLVNDVGSFMQTQVLLSGGKRLECIVKQGTRSEVDARVERIRLRLEPYFTTESAKKHTQLVITRFGFVVPDV
jgi:hypothetical protein